MEHLHALSSKALYDGMRSRRACRVILEHDPEKWDPVFGKGHAPARNMIPKSGTRFSEKVMLRQET
jgi:hypothetical protein